MRKLLKFRNLKKRDCATVVNDVFPYPRFAPHRTLLGYTVTTGLRNSKEGPCDLHGIMRNNTQCCVLRMSDSSVYNREVGHCRTVVTDEKWASLVRASVKLEEKGMQ
jgi:hypothetical protein